MFKNIFQRMFFTYLTISVISLATLAALLSHTITNHYLAQKQQELINQGKQINVVVNKPKNLNHTEKQDLVNLISETTGTKIYILNLPASITTASRLENLKDNYIAKDIPKIMSGEVVTRKRHFSSQLNMDVVYVGMPLKEESKITGVILLFSPLTEINKILNPIYRIIWFSALGFVFVAAILISLVSRRISRPIISMSQAAEDIASGNFETALDSSGVDEISQLAKSFDYMRNRIKLTERMRQELLANISHELRTPLTSIRGFIQAILDGVVEPEEQRKYLALSFQEADRLTKLTGDLLDMAKLQTGNLKLTPSEVRINEILNSCADTFRLACMEKNVQLKINFTHDMIIKIDPDRITQVLINLLSNALKFTPSGGIIYFSSTLSENSITIEVADNGIGIDQEELGKIFDYFYKTDKSRDANRGGSGIGLFVAKQLVELHGGTIAVFSQVDKGTTFTLKIPITN